MSNNIIAGLIECGTSGQGFLEHSPEISKSMQLRKAYVFHEGAKSVLRNRYPNLELTTDCEDIFQDETISLVFISAPDTEHRKLIGSALKANKQVRVV